MANNIDFLNVVRGYATADFNDRIPSATQKNIADLQNTILEYPVLKNEFLDILTNKVARTIFLQKLYENPFKFFKKGSLPYGKSIESIFVDLINGKSFSEKFGDGTSEASSLLAKEKANVKVEYYSENFQNKYKVSISDEQLKGAFMSAEGLQQLLNKILIAPLNSAEYDEFLMIKQALGVTETPKATVTGFATADDNVKAKLLTRAIKTHVSKFAFLSKAYNKQQVMSFSKPHELVILVTPDTKALLDVELLSSAFNMSKAEVEGRMVLIDEFQKLDADGQKAIEDTSTIAMIVDEEFIQFYETLTHSENFRNPDTLSTNMFLHKWGTIATCGYVNAIKLQK